MAKKKNPGPTIGPDQSFTRFPGSDGFFVARNPGKHNLAGRRRRNPDGNGRAFEERDPLAYDNLLGKDVPLADLEPEETGESITSMTNPSKRNPHPGGSFRTTVPVTDHGAKLQWYTLTSLIKSTQEFQAPGGGGMRGVLLKHDGHWTGAVLTRSKADFVIDQFIGARGAVATDGVISSMRRQALNGSKTGTLAEARKHVERVIGEPTTNPTKRNPTVFDGTQARAKQVADMLNRAGVNAVRTKGMVYVGEPHAARARQLVHEWQRAHPRTMKRRNPDVQPSDVKLTGRGDLRQWTAPGGWSGGWLKAVGRISVDSGGTRYSLDARDTTAAGAKRAIAAHINRRGRARESSAVGYYYFDDERVSHGPFKTIKAREAHKRLTGSSNPSRGNPSGGTNYCPNCSKALGNLNPGTYRCNSCGAEFEAK